MAGRIAFRPGKDWEDALMVATLLDLVTLRLARFWTRSRLRRLFFTAIEIDGDPLDYRGKPHELLVGFALSFCLLAPVAAGAAALLAVAEAEAAGSVLLAYAICGALAFGYGVAGYAARGYLLSRLAWRGVTGRQDGSMLQFGFLWLSWAVAFLLSAGLCVPRACRALAAYRWRFTRWGGLRGGFTGRAEQLEPEWRRIWLVHVLPLYAAAFWVLFKRDWHPAALPWELELAFDEMVRNEAGLILLWVAGGLWLYSGLMQFRIAWLRWLVNGCALGPIRFYCRLDGAYATHRLQQGILWVEGLVCAAFLLLLLTGGAETGFFGELGYTSFVWLASAMIFAAWLAARYLHLRFVFWPLMEQLLPSVAVINVTAAEQAGGEDRKQVAFPAGIADLGYAHFL